MTRNQVWMVQAMALAALIAGAPATAGGPVQLFVFADTECRASLQPGTQDLKERIPEAEYVYKTIGKGAARQRSCEVYVPRAEALEQFSYCALATHSASSCTLSWEYEGGRKLQLTVAGEPGRDAACGWTCLPR